MFAVRDHYWIALEFFVFAALGIYLVLGAGRFDLDDESITHQSRFGTWRMRWEDIEEVEIGTAGTLVLKGANKRFVLSPPQYWSGDDKTVTFQFLVQQIRSRNISQVFTKTADYKTMRNTRVSS